MQRFDIADFSSLSICGSEVSTTRELSVVLVILRLILSHQGFKLSLTIY